MKVGIVSLVSAAAVATALALAVPAGSAFGASAAVSGTEHFQLVSTSYASNTGQVIAYGAFVGVAVDHMGNAADTFVFKDGSFKVTHKNGRGGSQNFNSRTCLETVLQPGTFTISGGKGKYAGITGHGTFRLTILSVGARGSSGCSRTKPPVATQIIIEASGPVHF